MHGRTCDLFHAPTEVRLNADTKDNAVVQPDLLVVCDKSRIKEKGIVGAPDMIVVVLSPSTASLDAIKKYIQCMDAGAREYWIVDPAEKSVIANILKVGHYLYIFAFQYLATVG